MPFEKGNQEAKKGNKVKAFAGALRAAVNKSDGDRKKLDQIADSLVEEAIQGNIAAIKEVGDRLDGKPVQKNDNHNTHDVTDTFAKMVMDAVDGRTRTK